VAAIVSALYTVYARQGALMSTFARPEWQRAKPAQVIELLKNS
jgi:hypothetical protein